MVRVVNFLMASWFTRKVNIFMYVTEGYLSTLLILSAFHSFLGQIAPAMAIRSRDTEGGRTTRPPYPPPSNISWPFLPSFSGNGPFDIISNFVGMTPRLLLFSRRRRRLCLRFVRCRKGSSKSRSAIASQSQDGY